MKYFIILSLLIGLSGCGGDEEKKDDVIFFQAKQFFQQQINDIKNTPYFIHKVETINGLKDSTSITNENIDVYARPFIEHDINDPSVKKYYEESVFHDATTSSFSLSYTTSNKDLPIQTMNVLLREDGETVKRIFIRKYYSNSDSSTVEQLSWKPGESFEVNRIITYPSKPEKSHRVQVIWNAK